MQVRVSVKLADAIRRGLTECGEREIVIEGWEGWTEEERNHLAALVGYDGGRVVYTGDATVAGLHERIREDVERAAKETEAAKRAAEEREARIRKDELAMVDAFDQDVPPTIGFLDYAGKQKVEKAPCPSCGRLFDAIKYVPRSSVVTDELRGAIESWSARVGVRFADPDHVEKCKRAQREAGVRAEWMKAWVVPYLDTTDKARYKEGTVPTEEIEEMAFRVIDFGYDLLSKVNPDAPKHYYSKNKYPRQVWSAINYAKAQAAKVDLNLEVDVFLNAYDDHSRWSICLKVTPCDASDVQLFEWEMHVPTPPNDDE